jgi:hypothetical protein
MGGSPPLAVSAGPAAAGGFYPPSWGDSLDWTTAPGRRAHYRSAQVAMEVQLIQCPLLKARFHV